jgi:hypothetical protein
MVNRTGVFMKLIIGSFLMLVFSLPLFGQKWSDFSEKECEQIIKKRDVNGIIQIQKNSARGKGGGRANSNERFIIELLIKNRDFELLKPLLDNGLPTSYFPDYYDYSILNMCIPRGDVEMFTFLFPYCRITGIEISRIIGEKNVDMLKVLVKQKVNLDARADFYSIAGGPPTPDYSLFGYAVACRAFEIARLIYQAHPRLDINNIGRSPMWELPCSYRHTPLDSALSAKDRDMISWLKERGGRTFQELALSGKGLDWKNLVQGLARSTTDRLRIRDGFNLKSKVVGHLSEGEQVEIINLQPELVKLDGISGYWFFIRTGKGILGWVYGGYLKMGK